MNCFYDRNIIDVFISRIFFEPGINYAILFASLFPSGPLNLPRLSDTPYLFIMRNMERKQPVKSV